jgi:phospholipid transport system substrate-binding protein
MKTDMLRRAGLMGVLLLALAPLQAAEPVVDASSPVKLVETVSKALLADLDANRAAYRKDVTGLYKVVDKLFLPHVDVPFAAQQVLAKHWREATQAQRKRFIDALYQSLLTTYGKALNEFTSDQMKVLPFKGDPAAKTATVKTTVRTRNGTNVAVDYRLRKNDAGEWKAFDVVIENISYVSSFREDFGTEIDQKGLDSLLTRLEKGQLPKTP